MQTGNSGNIPFNKFGGITPRANTGKGQGPKEAPAAQEKQPQDPTESVIFGQQPAADTKVDSVSTGQKEASYVAPQVGTSAPSNIPTEINGAIIAGMGGTKKTSFPGLSLNGPRSNSITTVGGKTIASASPLAPKATVPMPTTSLSAVNSTFGGEPFYSVSGNLLG